MDKDLSRPVNARLTELDADQTAEMLAQAGMSPRLQTRLNAVIAWSVLAASAPGVESKERAVNGLLDAALWPLQESDDQEEVMSVAFNEVANLEGPLRRFAYQGSLARAHVGSREGGNAARLALLLAGHQPVMQWINSYRALWWVRFLTMGRTWVECIAPVSGAALAIGLGLFGGLNAVQKSGVDYFAASTIGWGEIASLSVLAAMLAAGLSIPTRSLVRLSSRVAEAIVQPLFVGLVVIVAAWLASEMSSMVFRRGMPLSLVERDYDAITDAINWLNWWWIPVLGLCIARSVAFGVPVRSGLARHLTLVVIVAGGWAAAGTLLAFWALLRTGILSDSDASLGTWPLWMVVVLAASAGIAWTDSRGRPFVRGDTPVKLEDRRSRPHRIIATLAFSGGAILLIVLGVAWWLLHAEMGRLNDKWQAFISTRVGDRIAFECTSASDTKPQLANVKPGILYPIGTCLGRMIRIEASETRARDSGNGLGLIDHDFLPVESDYTGFPSAVAVPAGPAKHPYYVCVAVGPTRCPEKQRASFDFASAILRTLTSQNVLAGLAPDSQLAPMLPESAETISLVLRAKPTLAGSLRDRSF